MGHLRRRKGREPQTHRYRNLHGPQPGRYGPDRHAGKTAGKSRRTAEDRSQTYLERLARALHGNRLPPDHVREIEDEWDCPGALALAPALLWGDWFPYFLKLVRTKWVPLPFERPADFTDFSIAWSEEEIARLSRPLDF